MLMQDEGHKNSAYFVISCRNEGERRVWNAEKSMAARERYLPEQGVR
jgi:hypothetical protein